jgi:hypothetical protein
MVLLAHKYEDARQIWAGIWAGYPRDVDLVGREGGILTSSSLFLSHIRFVGGFQKGDIISRVSIDFIVPHCRPWMAGYYRSISFKIFLLVFIL